MKAFNKEHYTNRNPQSVHVRDVRVMILTSGSEQILGGSNKNQLLYHENMYRPVWRGTSWIHCHVEALKVRVEFERLRGASDGVCAEYTAVGTVDYPKYSVGV